MPKAQRQTTAYAALAQATRLAPTQKQLDLLEIKLNDAGYETRVRRKDWVEQRLGHSITWFSDMSRQECSRLLTELEEDRESDRRPLAQARTPCGDCDGTGKVCGKCGKPWSGCEGYAGHRYDPVVCGGCDGKRFED